MAVNVLPVHVTSVFALEYQITTALHGHSVEATATLLAVINCSAERASDLGGFMSAAFEASIPYLETEGNGVLSINGVCQPADAEGAVSTYWSDDIKGSRSSQVVVFLFGSTPEVLPHFTRLRQLIQAGSFDKPPSMGDG